MKWNTGYLLGIKSKLNNMKLTKSKWCISPLAYIWYIRCIVESTFFIAKLTSMVCRCLNYVNGELGKHWCKLFARNRIDSLIHLTKCTLSNSWMLTRWQVLLMLNKNNIIPAIYCKNKNHLLYSWNYLVLVYLSVWFTYRYIMVPLKVNL